MVLPFSGVPLSATVRPNALQSLPGPSVNAGLTTGLPVRCSISSPPCVGRMPRTSTASGTSFPLVTKLSIECIP